MEVARTRTRTSADLDELRLREILAGADAVLDAVARMSPTFSRPSHMRPLAELVARHAAAESVRAVVSAPPRHSKSETIAHALAWLLFVRPSSRIALVSYGADLAEARSRRVRELAAVAGVRVARDQRALGSWRTMAGGEVRAVGVGGAITGFGFDLVVLDDVIANREQAESAGQREALAAWFTGVLMSRVEPGGSVIVTAARWHADDLLGRLVLDGWPSVNLPAIGSDGASLWPERWSIAQLREREREVGAYDWSSLYMGQPTPRGGAVFAAAATRFDPAELRAKLAAHTARIAVACDPAATARTHADHSAIVVAAFHGRPASPTMDVLSVWRGQVEVPDLVSILLDEQRRWRCPVGVESVGGFRGIGQMLRRVNGGLRVVELRATADKFTRAQPAAAAWLRGSIRVPPSAPWLSTFLAEVAAFTGTGADRHDDQVDALVHAWTMAGTALTCDRNSRALASIYRAFPYG